MQESCLIYQLTYGTHCHNDDGVWLRTPKVGLIRFALVIVPFQWISLSDQYDVCQSTCRCWQGSCDCLRVHLSAWVTLAYQNRFCFITALHSIGVLFHGCWQSPTPYTSIELGLQTCAVSTVSMAFHFKMNLLHSGSDYGHACLSAHIFINACLRLERCCLSNHLLIRSCHLYHRLFWNKYAFPSPPPSIVKHLHCVSFIRSENKMQKWAESVSRFTGSSKRYFVVRTWRCSPRDFS